jgi:ubiquinone/menaquinone biosynthesis C-methylase UbiE/PAS domain-containing protein
MPDQVTVLRVFVSSPGDLGEERDLLAEVVDQINQSDGMSRRVLLQLWRWEENGLRLIGKEPQQVVDDQLPRYDVYFGILGGRFGTPTRNFGSGTEKEFNDALERYEQGDLKWILFYFRTAVSPPRNQQELEQYGRVLQFKETISKLGLIREYGQVRGSKQAFVECAERDLRAIVTTWQQVQEVAVTEADDSGFPTSDAAEPEVADPDVRSPAQLYAQFGYFEPTTALDERGQIIERSRRAVFDVTVPAYLLDTSFHFLDWNTAFDELIAKPLKINRSRHALEFIQALDNCGEVIERSKKRFGYNRPNPIVDIEPLIFRSPELGEIRFQKIAAQIVDQNGNPTAWSVTLNIEHAEKPAELWKLIEERLTDEYNWTRYAVSYDRLLLPFKAYTDMVEKVVAMVGPSKLCVDLGAGTGTPAVRLLESNPERIVWAIDYNDAMLQFLQAKAREKSRNDPSILNRLTTIKGNLLRLTQLSSQKNYFDAAVMINVLYAVEDPVACLTRAADLLKPAGTLVLTTPHKGTDVRKLFVEMRRRLTELGLFESLRDNYAEAKRVHKRMDHLIHRDSIDEIHQYLNQAGFDIEHEEPEYVDSVVLIKAVKREEW